MFNPLKGFLSNRRQRVILNGQCSSWADIPFGAPQYSIVCPLLLLIYINELSFRLKGECKLFAENTCLFSVVHVVIISKNDQTVLSNNPDLSEQGQEIIFSRKVSKSFRPDVHFENNPVNLASVCKHVGIILDSK